MSTLDSIFESELDKELEKVTAADSIASLVTNSDAQPSDAKPKKKRVKRKAEESELVKATNRKKRVSRNTAVVEEIQRMRDEHAAIEQTKPIDGISMAEEINAARERAIAMLEELEHLLSVGTAAVQASTKYAVLVGLLERHRTESAVLEKTCAVFTKMLNSVASARDSCARLPAEFLQLLLRHEAYMRASSSALVPSGISVLASSSSAVAAAANAAKDKQLSNNVALTPTSSMQRSGIVRYGGPQSSSTFKLHVEERTPAQVSELQNSFLATSMMHHNYNPLQTVTGTNALMRDAQRRAASLIAGSEFMPELLGANQQALEAAKAQEVLGVQPRLTAAASAPVAAIEAGDKLSRHSRLALEL